MPPSIRLCGREGGLGRARQHQPLHGSFMPLKSQMTRAAMAPVKIRSRAALDGIRDFMPKSYSDTSREIRGDSPQPPRFGGQVEVIPGA